MNNLILSTKNTVPKKQIHSQIFINVAGIIIFFILGQFISDVFSDYSDSSATMWIIFSLIIQIAVTIFYVILIIRNIYDLYSYVDIYENHIEGAGIQGKKFVPFKIDTKHILGVSAKGMIIVLSTTIGTYTITSNVETANKVYDHFNK